MTDSLCSCIHFIAILLNTVLFTEDMYNLNQIPNVSLSCSERDEGSQSRDQYEKLSRYIDSFAKSYFSRRGTVE